LPAALGKPTIAVVAMGRPQGLVAVIDRLPAVLTAYYGARIRAPRLPAVRSWSRHPKL
jgi:hypothetical protein